MKYLKFIFSGIMTLILTGSIIQESFAKPQAAGVVRPAQGIPSGWQGRTVYRDKNNQYYIIIKRNKIPVQMQNNNIVPPNN